MKVDPSALQAIEKFEIPKEIKFGTVMGPVMIRADYQGGKWSELNLLPYGPLSLDPASKVLHYAQEIFEGLKAYKRSGGPPYLFRPQENARRFERSAERMAMPSLPADSFLAAVEEVTRRCDFLIPTGEGESLYIRPFMFASQKHVGIGPSQEYVFLTFVCPVGSYFSGPELRVLIQRQFCRAAPGGTGAAKAGGNYAASLVSTETAFQRGCQQSLWLDAVEKKYVEELSGMNLFFVIDGELHTPKLTDTILPGITRDSIIQLAAHEGFGVRQRHIPMAEVTQAIGEGRCTEAFACGTAAIIAPIHSFKEENGEELLLPPFSASHIGTRLREKLMGLQYGLAPDPFGWRREINLDEGST